MPRRTTTTKQMAKKAIPVETQGEMQTLPERIVVIDEYLETFTPQELLTIRDRVEQMIRYKLEEAKAAIIKEAERSLKELGFTLNDAFSLKRDYPPKGVLPSKRDYQKEHKRNPTAPIKYRSPTGDTWTGNGRLPRWLKDLETQGHNREEFAVAAAPIGAQTGE